jgi:hypothetical protein
MAEETEIPFGKTGISYYENMIDTVRNLQPTISTDFDLTFPVSLVA